MPSAMTIFQKVRVTIVQLLASFLILAGTGYSNTRAASDATPPPLASLFGGPFDLVDQDNVVRSEKDYLGKFMLVYFGYVNCPAICPANLQEMALALDELGSDGKKVRPVFITLDPQRDTPAKLKGFVANFGPDFVGLTGTEAQIKAMAKAYKIIRRKVTPPDLKSENDYLVFHSTLIFLLGPDGRFLTFFPINIRGVEMAARIRKYLIRPSSS